MELDDAISFFLKNENIKNKNTKYEFALGDLLCFLNKGIFSKRYVAIDKKIEIKHEALACIFEKLFWEKIKKIPYNNLKVKVFDIAMLFGLDTALVLFNESLGLKNEKDITYKTFSVLQGDPTEIENKYISQVIKYFENICDENKKLEKYFDIWCERIKKRVI